MHTYEIAFVLAANLYDFKIFLNTITPETKPIAYNFVNMLHTHNHFPLTVISHTKNHHGLLGSTFPVILAYNEPFVFGAKCLEHFGIDAYKYYDHNYWVQAKFSNHVSDSSLLINSLHPNLNLFQLVSGEITKSYINNHPHCFSITVTDLQNLSIESVYDRIELYKIIGTKTYQDQKTKSLKHILEILKKNNEM
jgi:hypothetical protein